MALDEAMARQSALDDLVRIRFYTFQPPCLSLGHHQKRNDVDENACRERGYDVAVRPTGGRAVLHKGDFVYCVTVPETERLPDSGLHTGVYNLVALALARGLRKVGIEPDDAARHLDAPTDIDLPKLCFSSTTRHEVTSHGKKLVGSAQRILRGAVLQHGSLLITDEHLELTDLLAGIPDERKGATRRALEIRTTNLRELGFEGGFDDLVDVMRGVFSVTFDGLEESKLDDFLPDDIIPSV
jgi:lipoate-protein ligase A